MNELWYWCWRRNDWLRVEGPDYPGLEQAVYAANQIAASTSRVIRVTDLYSGEVMYQTGVIPRESVQQQAASSWYA
jgi:hypothetical protein